MFFWNYLKQYLGKIRVNQVTPITILVVAACVTYILIYAVIWMNMSKACVDVFYRPYERHRMRIKPIRQNAFPLEQLEWNDKKKLINLRNFSFIINNENLCDISEVFLLVLVPSAPNNKIKRQNIRETWGHTDRNIVVVFLLGYVDDNELQRQIKEENSVYKDLVQGNFLDSYKNLTYKTIMSFKYAIYYCPKATYILKIDDDSFVNMPLLRNFLRNDISPFGAEDLLLCNDMTGSPVLRDNRSKWYATEEEFPGDMYPSYCSGWYTVFSPDICFKLYRESQKLKYFFIEDVFVYGMAANRVPGLTHTDINHYTLTFRNYELLFNGSYDNLNIMFGSTNMSPDLIRKFWDYFRQKPVSLSVYKKNGRV